MNEVPLHRPPVLVEHHRHRFSLDVGVRLFGADEVAPARPTEHILPERELVPEVVLLHDPRRPQTAVVEVVLQAVLLEHHFLEYLRQRVAAGVRRVRLCLGDGEGMRIEEVPDRRVSADEDEPPEGGTDAAGFEQPEEPLDRDVEDRFGRLLGRRQMNHVGGALRGGIHDAAVLDRAGDDLEPRFRLQQPVVAQRSDRDPG